MADRNDEIRPEPPRRLHPWLGILFQPRSTMLWLLRHETQQSARTMWLSFTALFIVIMFIAVFLYPGDFDRAAVRIRLVIATPVIFALSYLYFIVESYMLHKAGEWLGGRSHVADMRVVNAYTTVVPGVILGLLNVGLSVLFGHDSPLPGFAGNLILGWTIYITAVGIAAAAGFSPWKGLLVYLVTLLLWLGLAALVGLLVFGQLPAL
ncbi:MAG: Yip1 family protein [Negativicutes bacterium]|nr:Yip1 family protein [Negativicutes bacterium]